MVDQGRPALGFARERGLSPAAEIFGVCLAKSVPIVQFQNSQERNGFMLKRYNYDIRHAHGFSLDSSTWGRVKRIPWSQDQEMELLEDLAAGYRDGTWFDRKFLHQGKQIKSASKVREQLGLDPLKKTAVIFSHVLWDATFFYGKGLFDDYETWLTNAVRAAVANPKVNWVIKLHPDLSWKLKYEGFSGELREISIVRDLVGGNLPPHVKFVLPDTDISTYSFYEVADYCLTVRGTIGIEMACAGVNVVTAGTGRYSGLGFTVDSDTAEEYLQRLANIESLPPMSREKRELARRYAYTVFKFRSWRAETFEIVKMPMENIEHPLAMNIITNLRSFDEFAQSADINKLSEWSVTDAADYLEPGLLKEETLASYIV